MDLTQLIHRECYAFAVPTREPTRSYALYMPELREPPSGDALPVGDYELLIWHPGGQAREDATSEVVDYFNELSQALSDCISGMAIECGGLVAVVSDGSRRCLLRRWWSPVFIEALERTAHTVGELDVEVLRALSFDPSRDADEIRSAFWRELGRAYHEKLIMPLQEVASSCSIRLAWDWSHWRNPLSPWVAFGDVRECFGLKRHSGAHEEQFNSSDDSQGMRTKLDAYFNEDNTMNIPIIVLRHDQWLLQLFTSLREHTAQVITIARISATKMSEELEYAWHAIRNGAYPLWCDLHGHPEMHPSVTLRALLHANWWLRKRSALNHYLARMLAGMRHARRYAPMAVVTPLMHFQGKLHLSRIANEAMECSDAWRELDDLLHRFHFDYDWVPDDNMVEASVIKKPPIQVSLTAIERVGLCIGRGCYTVAVLPTPQGCCEALWVKLSEFYEAGGSIFLLGAPPPPSEVSAETEFLKWVHATARSYQVRFALQAELGAPVDDLSPVTYQNPHGGCLGMFDWRLCPDKVESPLMTHRMLLLALRPLVETHHTAIKTAVRWLNETPLIMVWNSSGELAEFHLRIRCVGTLMQWQAIDGSINDYLHYARVEEEVDAEETLCIVTPLTLQPYCASIISVPTGMRPHVAAANFAVTHLEVNISELRITGYARQRHLDATVSIGRRTVEIAHHCEMLPDDPRALDRCVRVLSQYGDIVIVAQVHQWQWMPQYRWWRKWLHGRIAWTPIAEDERVTLTNVPAKHVECILLRTEVNIPPSIERLILWLERLPEGWLTLAINNRIIACSSAEIAVTHTSRATDDLSSISVISTPQFFDATSYINHGRMELVMRIHMPDKGSMHLPAIWLLMHLCASSGQTIDDVFHFITASDAIAHVHALRNSNWDLQVRALDDVDELRIEWSATEPESIVHVARNTACDVAGPAHVATIVGSHGQKPASMRVQVSDLKLMPVTSDMEHKMELRWSVASKVHFNVEVE
ncbi:MAG TPA: hypothetical protein EYP10_02640 [Armatimonadetes bacterium]|nr:hypothetical protein [Armatimonadota bacterium]